MWEYNRAMENTENTASGVLGFFQLWLVKSSGGVLKWWKDWGSPVNQLFNRLQIPRGPVSLSQHSRGLVFCPKHLPTDIPTHFPHPNTRRDEVETETNLKDMSHFLSDAWRSTEMTCQAVSQLGVRGRMCMLGVVEPQIAFNWKFKLSDSLRLSCQSRCSHHGYASTFCTDDIRNWLHFLNNIKTESEFLPYKYGFFLLLQLLGHFKL